MTERPYRQDNPYVGPRPFITGETLYGRDAETFELLDLLIAERVVLLFSPSGAGKSSLIQAALIPALERKGFLDISLLRVSALPPPGTLDPSAIANRYLFSLLLSLEEQVAAEQRLPLATLAGISLEDYLKQRPKVERGKKAEVLIFDQFEEILTLNPADVLAKEAFFAQLGIILEHPRRWVLFSMREDYVASLDPYLRALPNQLRVTYRLNFLEV